MNVKRILKFLISVVYVAFLALICCSPNQSVDESGVSKGLLSGPKVNFECGSFPVDSTELTMTVKAEEISRLDSFTALSSVDLSGSSCYKEIADWAQAHPQVAVRYSVEFPGGVTADNSTQSLDLSGLTGSGAEQVRERLAYLPQLTQVELGSSAAADPLSPQQLADICSSYPQLSFTYEFSVAGRQLNLTDSVADLRGITGQQAQDAALYLSCMRQLETVELGTESDTAPDTEAIALLQQACPQAQFNYQMTLFGVTVSLTDTVLDLNHVKMDDEGAAVRRVISVMPRLQTLDMDYCGVSDQAMASIRADFPNVDVIWRIWFGENYSVRTDTERILASMPSVGGVLYDDDVYVLRYCTKVKYLDLGHNEDITNMDYVAFMPDLEVLIVAMSGITDLSPLENCPKLEYLEIFTTPVSDLTPLSGLTGLHHLNIHNCENLTDISPLYSLPALERLWIGAITPVPVEQAAHIKELLPDCVLNVTCQEQEMGVWRYTAYDPEEPKYYWVPRYELLRKQMGYNYQEYSFYWLDPKCGDEAPPEYAGKYGNIYE